MAVLQGRCHSQKRLAGASWDAGLLSLCHSQKRLAGLCGNAESNLTAEHTPGTASGSNWPHMQVGA